MRAVLVGVAILALTGCLFDSGGSADDDGNVISPASLRVEEVN